MQTGIFLHLSCKSRYIQIANKITLKGGIYRLVINQTDRKIISGVILFSNH